MENNLVAFGIAKDILASSQLAITIQDGATISTLKKELISAYPEFEKLQSLKFAINEDYESDEYVLKAQDEVVIIPPVSGG